jgi:hypothetical protein
MKEFETQISRVRGRQLVEISHLKYGGDTREVVFAVEEAGRQ